MEYYIYVTNECNLNCSYCSVLVRKQGRSEPLKPIYSKSVLFEFIDKIQQKYNDNTADIYFFGGEPTLEYGVIADIISVFNRKTTYKINYVMHTNGLRLDSIPKYIIKKTDIMLLSMNYEKIYIDKHLSPYLSKIMNNINYVRRIKNFPIIGRITVSPDTCLYTECCLMGAHFDYIYWQLDNSTYIPFEIYKTNYETSISLLFSYWINFLKAGVFLRYVPFINTINHFLNPSDKPSKFYCGYGESMIYIQTDGSCYACCDEVESRQHYIGNLEEGVEFPEINLLNTICNECKYIYVCGGRCGRMHIDHGQERISEFCQLNIFMFSLIEEAIPLIRKIILKFPNFISNFNDPLIAYTEYTP